MAICRRQKLEVVSLIQFCFLATLERAAGVGGIGEKEYVK